MIDRICKICHNIQSSYKILEGNSRGEQIVKSTGIVRKVDELGRIVLPIELRRTLDISEKDTLEIYVEGSAIVLRKYRPSCIFCDSTRDVFQFKGKNLCPRCLKELQNHE